MKRAKVSKHKHKFTMIIKCGNNNSERRCDKCGIWEEVVPEND